MGAYAVLISKTNFLPFLDKFAISTTAVCAFHCLFLPISLVFFPTLGATFLGKEIFHEFLLYIIIPSSTLGLFLGCRLHKSYFVALTGIFGLSILIFAAFLGHAIIGESGERLAVIIGGTAIAIGHFRNFSLCRSINC